ncbi:nucleotidyltransferase family protein [Mesorhizobium sp. KR9-304]|uniref:nucleotidyltransferase family protein n=1 Tax=Mesorhizobium sp. KR9-304 TaxID=3156614 RepID=UPI0032B57D02
MRGKILALLLRSAWPRPSIDRLLRAAMLDDSNAAAAAWHEFEASADFDHLTAGEMRLIAFASRRLRALAPESPMRARIGGIERANWSQSQMVIGEAGGGLRVLAAASIDMLVIKGAGRLAAGGPTARGRVVNDVDVVVRPDDLKRAFDLLTADGWLPAESGTAVYHAGHLAGAVGINLVRGRFGNLDLHRTAFHPPYESAAEDAAIWDRSASGAIAYTPVRVPSATDAVAIAIAHGSLDAHKSSDWLVDIAVAIDSGVDWVLLQEIIERRRLHAAAATALGYARERLERPVPESVIVSLEKKAARRPVSLLAALAETRPKTDRIGFFWLARAVAKQSRLMRTYRRRFSGDRRRVVLPSLLTGGSVTASGAKVLEEPLVLPDRKPGEAWRGSLDITVSVDLPPASRRIDFELNSHGRHHARLRAIVLNRGRRERLLRFNVPVELAPDDTAPVLVAAASRIFNANAPQALVERYAATPFRVVRLRTRRLLPKT